MKLTKKEISGYGAYHVFKDVVGGLVFEKCTQAEYDRMGGPGGSKYNPVREGLTWQQSFSGTPEVEGRLMGEGEYVELPSGDKFAKMDGQNLKLESGDLDLSGNFIGLIKT